MGSNRCLLPGEIELFVFLNDKLLMRFTVYINSHIIGLLSSQAARIGLWHVVLHERRHFPNVVHASPVVIGIRTPHGGYRGRFSRTIRAVAQRTLQGVDLTASIAVSVKFRKLHESASRKWMACHLILGQP